MVRLQDASTGLRSARQIVADYAEDAVTLARLTRDMRLFLRHPVTLEVARRRLADRLAQREQRLLTLVERCIYNNHASSAAPSWTLSLRRMRLPAGRLGSSCVSAPPLGRWTRR